MFVVDLLQATFSEALHPKVGNFKKRCGGSRRCGCSWRCGGSLRRYGGSLLKIWWLITGDVVAH